MNTGTKTLLEIAKMLTALGFLVVPLGEDRKPTIKWSQRRDKPLTEEEIEKWFSTDKDGNSSRAKGLGYALGSKERPCIAIDTDGEEATEVFEKEFLPRCGEDLQAKFNETTLTKTPSQGKHWIFRIYPKDFPDGITQKEVWKIPIETASAKHSEIELLTTNFFIRECGPDYVSIRDFEKMVLLYRPWVKELEYKLEEFKKETSTLRTIGNCLKPYYYDSKRDGLVMAVSGYLWKYGNVPKYLTIRLFAHIVRGTAYQDENWDKIVDTIERTYSKAPNTKDVSGRERLLAAVDGKEEVLAEIEQGFKQLDTSYFPNLTSNGTTHGNTIDLDPDINNLPFEVKTRLSPHVFSLIGRNPLRFYVADEYKKEIMKVVVSKPKDTTETTESNAATTTTTTKTKTIKYMEKDVMIDAIPSKVIINDNPLDGNKTYQITWMHKGLKRPFTVGPGSIKFQIEELQNRGRLVAARDAIQALTAILVKYEDSEKAEVTNKPPQSGYYWIDNNKIVGYDITQQDIDPAGNEEDKKKVMDCIEVIDGLYARNKNKVAFATVIKWSIGSSFSYARKQLNHGRSNWQPDVHAYGRSRAGKNTEAMCALAVWRKHTSGDVDTHVLGFGSINSEAKFARAVSKTTYFISVHEVGPLRLDKFEDIRELEKHKVESLVARGAHNRENRRFGNDGALSSIFFTSNPPPSDEAAYRIRVRGLPFNKKHDTTDAEKLQFEQWFYIEGRIDKLGVLGDWATKCIMTNPERYLRELTWDDAGKEILRALYTVVGKEPPEWIDLLETPNVIQDANEATYFEFRGFLDEAFMEGYRKYHKYDDIEKSMTINYDTKLSETIQQGYLPFVTQHTNKMRHEKEATGKVVIMPNVISELARCRITTITTMQDVANAIPGFSSGSIKKNGETWRVVYGSQEDLKAFLRPEMTIEDKEGEKEE